MKEQKVREGVRRRGIFLLPNLLTTASLFFGFYAIVISRVDKFEAAAIAIFVAMIFDGLDGRIARLTNTESAFGAQYDSLSDMISFGLAPALVVYEWALIGAGKLGWLAVFIYTAATALRLARFNTQVTSTDKRFFQGLASPAAAAVMAGMVWVGFEYDWEPYLQAPVAFAVTVTCGLLMVSNIRYRSFKDIDLKGRVPFVALLVVVLVFVLISLDPSQVLFAVFLLYAVSGPVMTLIYLQRHRRTREITKGKAGDETGEDLE